jgi:hypothetical protein
MREPFRSRQKAVATYLLLITYIAFLTAPLGFVARGTQKKTTDPDVYYIYI